jgi:hypothetical protein
MEINRKKIPEVMVCSKDSIINTKMDDNPLKQVPKFKYLGSIITEDGTK